MTDGDLFDLDEVVRRFSNAEHALVSFLDQAQTLSGAREELMRAKEDLATSQAEAVRKLEEARLQVARDLSEADELAVERLKTTIDLVQQRLGNTETAILTKFQHAEAQLDTSQRSLADVASGLYRLTVEMRDVTRDVRDCAIALRGLDPNRMAATIEDLKKGQSGLLKLFALSQLLLLAVAAGFASYLNFFR